jgi:hypothetical protein
MKWQSLNYGIKLRTMGLSIAKKQKYKCWMLAEEKLYDQGTRLEHTHRKSLKHLAQDNVVSMFSAWRAIKLLKLRPYKMTVIHALHSN